MDKSRGRFKRFAATDVQLGHNQQSIIQAIAGQRLVVPCRNYTLVMPTSRRVGSAPPSSPASKLPAAAAAAPFNLIVPQITGISLIIWHKDNQLNSPIFAADARGANSIREARQQISSELLRGRARLELADFQNRLIAQNSLNTNHKSSQNVLPALVIEPATVQDAGLYTCTVEFSAAPTQTYLARAEVADPPKNMIVRDESAGGQRLYSSLAGPYDEESHLTLVCEVEPGQPSAGHVSWWQLDSVTPLSGDQIASAQRRQLATSSSTSSSNGKQTTQLLQSLDTKSDYVSTISFDLDGSSGDSETIVATTLSPDELVFSDSEQGAATTASSGEPNPLQSNDLFLAAHLGPEVEVAQLINFVIAKMPAVLGRQHHRRAHLRHWRRVQNKTSTSSEGKLRAHLELNPLSRANLGDEYLCLASSSSNGQHQQLIATPPLNASVSLNLNLRPVEVRLENKTNGTFKLGQKVVVECHAIGSKPSAVIKWFRNSQEVDTSVRSNNHTGGATTSLNYRANSKNGDEEEDLSEHYDQISEFNRDIGNLTKISYLTFVPRLSDNGRQLSCSAHNPRLSQITTAVQLSDSLTMNVQFAPKLKLQFGTSIRPDAIQLASDIFMDCNIQSNPPFIDLVWLHNGAPLVANVSAGIIMSNQSLVLRHLQIKHRGTYQCLAHNLLGRTASNELELRPKFAPICDYARTRTKLELALNQPARIDCHMLAEPGEDLHFTWRFNRSTSLGGGNQGDNNGDFSRTSTSQGDHHQLQDDDELRQFDTNFTHSSLLFTPRTRRHFGQLLCMATNSVVGQERACVIQLTQSELPEPVLGCFIDNQTHSSFSIHCQPPATGASASGSSRAGQTYFILELFANETLNDFDGTHSQGAHHQDRKQRQQQQEPRLTSAPGDSHLSLRNFEGGEPRHLSLQDQPMDDSRSLATTFDDDEETSGQDDEQLERRRVKRLLSDTPSFDVLDLKPNSSYNILVYVQNSKGRSAPTHHQAFTRPLDASAALSTGRLELLAGRRDERSGSSGSFASKLLNYLPLGTYFSSRAESSPQSAGGRHPLASVALVVLLATVSLLTLVFLTSRFLCQARNRGRHRPQVTPRACHISDMREEDDEAGGSHESKKRELSMSSSELRGPINALQRRNLLSSGSSSSSLSRGAVGRAQPATIQRSLTQQQQQGANAHNQNSSSTTSTSLGARQNCAGGAGSGSDTSRETNTTDSTLVSSPQTTGNTTENSSWQSTRASQSFQQQQQQAAMFYNSMQRNNCSRDNLSNSLQAVLYSTGSLQKVPPVAYSRVCKHPDGRHAAAAAAAAATHFYDPSLDQRHTPQISVHSSECSATGNIPQEHQCHSDNLEQRLCERVYVLDHHNQQQQHHQMSPLLDNAQANCLLESDWFNQANCGSALMNRCHLIEGTEDEAMAAESQAMLEMGPAMGGMPSSFSIPVALNDRLQVITRSGSLTNRRLSQENLSATTLLLKQPGNQFCNPTGSYLALAAAAPVIPTPFGPQELEYCVNSETPLSSMGGSALDAASGNHHEQQVQLTPPIDFASDYRRFKQSFGIGPGGQVATSSACSSPALPLDPQRQQQQQRHRVKFEPLLASTRSQAGDG